jgi:hypothetical protein
MVGIVILAMALLIGGVLLVLHLMRGGDEAPPIVVPPTPDAMIAKVPLDAAEIDAGMSKDDIYAISRFGYFSITATAKTTIYIDDQKIGFTPLTRLPILPGPHKVKAIGPRGKTKTFSITIHGGRDTEARHQLVNVRKAALGIALASSPMPLASSTSRSSMLPPGASIRDRSRPGGAIAGRHAALAFVGVGRLVTSRPELVRVLALGAAGLIIGYAVFAWRRRGASRVATDDSSMLHGATTGFALTLPNPGALAAWVAVAASLWPDATIAEASGRAVGVGAGAALWVAVRARWVSRASRP